MNPISRIEFERLFGGRVLRLDRRPRDPARRRLLDAQRGRQQLVHRGGPHPDGGLRLLPAPRLRRLAARTQGPSGGRPGIAVAVAIPGLFATTVVATQTYDLISPVIGLEAAALIGVLGVFIAVRWSSMLVGSVGMLGALAAPMLVGTDDRRRLDRLRRAGARRQRRGPPLAALELVGARRLRRLGAAADRLGRESGFITFEGGPIRANPSCSSLRSWSASGCSTPPRPSATSCAAAGRRSSRSPPGCCCSAAASWSSAPAASSSGRRFRLGLNAWIFGFAGRPPPARRAAAIRFGVHREIGSLLIGGGIGLGSFGLAHAFDGPTLVAAWSALAAALAFLATRVDRTPSRRRSPTRSGC